MTAGDDASTTYLYRRLGIVEARVRAAGARRRAVDPNADDRFRGLYIAHEHVDHLLGRVTSAFWTIHGAPGPIGAALLGWAAGRYGVGPVLVTAGTGCLLLAAIALFTPIRLAAPERMSTAA